MTTAKLHEFATKKEAIAEWNRLTRLGHQPHELFGTTRLTWAFWTR